MFSKYKELKQITVDVNNLIAVLQTVKKTKSRVTLNIDYATKTIYIAGRDILHQLKGF